MKGGEVYTGTLEYYKSENNRKKNLLKGGTMPIRLRRRLRMWPYCGYWGWWHHPYGPPPPWWTERPTKKEEIEALKEHIEMLKEELKAAEEELKESEKSR